MTHNAQKLHTVNSDHHTRVHECVSECASQLLLSLSHEDRISFLSAMILGAEAGNYPKATTAVKPIKDAGPEVHKVRPLSVHPPTYYANTCL